MLFRFLLSLPYFVVTLVQGNVFVGNLGRGAKGLHVIVDYE